MRDSAFIKQVHTELQNLCPKTTMLFSGSFLYGHATETSDLDFYCIGGIAELRKAKKLLQTWKKNNGHEDVHIMLVPTIFFKRGWYYIYGRDREENIQASKHHRRINIANGIKFSYFYFLKLLNATTEVEQQQYAWKCAQKIGLTMLALTSPHASAEPLTIENLISYLAQEREVFQPVITILEARLQNRPLSEFEINTFSHFGTLILDKVYRKTVPKLGFSLVQYCLYNAKYLPKGNGLFLFANPDKMILLKMRHALAARTISTELLSWLKEYIFPVVII